MCQLQWNNFYTEKPHPLSHTTLKYFRSKTSIVINQDKVVEMSHGCLEFCLVDVFHVLIKVQYAAILIIYFNSSSSTTTDMRTETACQSSISLQSCPDLCCFLL